MDSKHLSKRIRLDSLMMVNHSHASHIGAALSIADIVAVLYNDILNINPNNIDDAARDRFILSKGHSGIAIYSALAEKGFFDKDCLKTYGDDDTVLSCHVSQFGVPGVEFSTGSLGHGCCVAAGTALAAKMNHMEYYTYSIAGDGECNEGSVWEMALFASKYKLDNLVLIIDKNNLQGMGYTKDVMDTSSLQKKFSDFGWDSIEINGHNHNEIKDVLNKVRTMKNGKPKCIVANTIKGKGVSFMENQLKWHYKDPQNEEYSIAVKEVKDGQQ